MTTIKKILFPVDFSPACHSAAKHVDAMACRFQAAVTILNVAAAGEPTPASEVAPLQRDAQLDAFAADKFSHVGVRRLRVIASDPAASIAAEAGRWGADLVMMPTHGAGAFRRFLLGSVAAKVLHDVACPVWTNAHAENAPQPKEIRCRRILCALHLDERSEPVLRWAAWLATQFQAGLGIVHAMPTAAMLFPITLQESFVSALRDEAQRKIERLIAQTEQSALAAQEIYVRSGDPPRVISGVARDFGADLIVIGRHNRSGVRGHLLQNAYSIMQSSPCPVISI